MLKLTHGSANSRKVKSAEDFHSSPGGFVSAALSLDLPPFQANRHHIRPPLSRRSAATDHRRPDTPLAGEMAQFSAAANNNALAAVRICGVELASESRLKAKNRRTLSPCVPHLP